MPIGGIIKGARKIGQAAVKEADTPVLDDILNDFKVEPKPKESDLLDEIMAELEAPGNDVGFKPGPTPEEAKADDLLDEILDEGNPFAGLEEAVAKDVPASKKALLDEDDPLDALLKELEAEEAKADKAGFLDMGDPADEKIAKSNLLSKFTDFEGKDLDKDAINILIGSEWAVKMHNMEVMGLMSKSELQDVINHMTKEASFDGVPTTEEMATWDKFTDLIEEVPSVIGSTKIEDIDIDKLTIGNHNQDSPIHFDDMFTDRPDAPDWIFNKDEETQAAIAMMSHVRGIRFPQIQDEIATRYVNRKGVLYPPRDTFLLMEPQDVMSINFYTRAGDGIMNHALRTDAVEPGSGVDTAIKMTSEALDRLPSWNPEDGLLYRRVNDTQVRALFSEMPVGQEYTEKAFMSSTRDRIIDLDDMTPTKGPYVPDVVFVIKPKKDGNGKPIELLSEFQAEDEVLFKPRSQFKIMHKEEVQRDPESPNAGTSSVIFIEEL